MTSVNTNAAAITALRTLQQTNQQLDSTQSRISTGLKIGEAKDNAAYWAISTTLKSDNKSLGTVKDALGLGSATVDVAYQGLNKTKDVLDEIKAKLTAATQDGVDRDVIQSEISELQKQLSSIAGSSVFSGENWLSVDSSNSNYTANKAVVASFSRSADGSVEIGTIGVNIANVALFDASNATDAGGILDGKLSLTAANGRDLAFGGVSTATGNVSKAGLVDATDTGVGAVAISDVGETGVKATVSLGTAFANITGIGAKDTAHTGDGLSITVTTDTGASQVISMTYAKLKAADTAGNADDTVQVNEFIAAFNADAASTTAGVEAYQDGTAVKLRRTTAGEFGTLTSVTVASLNTGGSGTTAGLATVGGSYTLGSGNPKITTTGLDLSGLGTTDKIQFSFKIDGVVTPINVAKGADLDALIVSLNGASGFNGVGARASKSGNELVITSLGTGTGKSIELTSVTYTDGSNVVKEPTATTNLPYNEKAMVRSSAFSGAVALDTDDKIQFDLSINGSTAKLVTIDRALINSALGVNTGAISNATQYATVLTAAITKAGLTGVTVANDAGQMVFSTTQRGATAQVAISNSTATSGAQTMSIDKMDISAANLANLGADTGDKIRSVISAYVTLVNNAINKVTSAAANLGSVASRIDMQKSFVNTLMDTIDKGVGNLIDADMSEESTKLQALQVKQQLGVQALSIANQSSQNILSLFRG